MIRTILFDALHVLTELAKITVVFSAASVLFGLGDFFKRSMFIHLSGTYSGDEAAKSGKRA